MPRIKKQNNLVSEILSIKGIAKGELSLPVVLFGGPINKALLAQSLHVYHQNQRQGTQSTKTRSEVTGSTRKIYRQKGTGRARHGDIKAPIFIGGGLAHGPKPRDIQKHMSKKMRFGALASALALRHEEKAITFIDTFEEIKGKTKEMVQVLQKLRAVEKPHQDEKILLVLSKPMVLVERATRNLSSVVLRYAPLLTTHDILRYEKILMTKDSISALEMAFVPSKKDQEGQPMKTLSKTRLPQKISSSPKKTEKKPSYTTPKKIKQNKSPKKI